MSDKLSASALPDLLLPMTGSGAFRYRYYYSHRCLSTTGTVLSQGVVAVYKRSPHEE